MSLIAISSFLALTAACTLPDPDLLGEAAGWREIPFEVVDGKPLISASIGEARGRLMFDTGTPVSIMLNRDALDLDEGIRLRDGQAASGQVLSVREHHAPPVRVSGQPMSTPSRLLSGDFGFVEVAFGPDFLGFLGSPAVSGGAFVLDYGRQVLTILQTQADCTPVVGQPPMEDVVARFSVARLEGGQPTTGAFIGSLPVALDVDTGDGGTFYVRPETRAALEARGVLTPEGELAMVGPVSFGGAVFERLSVNLIEAGGPEDVRPWPGSNALRLGARFLALNPSLWNFAADTITILRPGSGFLRPR
jgi:hypothetical protein